MVYLRLQALPSLLPTGVCKGFEKNQGLTINRYKYIYIHTHIYIYICIHTYTQGFYKRREAFIRVIADNDIRLLFHV